MKQWESEYRERERERERARESEGKCGKILLCERERDEAHFQEASYWKQPRPEPIERKH